MRWSRNRAWIGFATIAPGQPPSKYTPTDAELKAAYQRASEPPAGRVFDTPDLPADGVGLEPGVEKADPLHGVPDERRARRQMDAEVQDRRLEGEREVA